MWRGLNKNGKPLLYTLDGNCRLYFVLMVVMHLLPSPLMLLLHPLLINRYEIHSLLFNTLALTMVIYLSLYSHCQPMIKAVVVKPLLSLTLLAQPVLF